MKKLAIILFGALLSNSAMAQNEPNFGADETKCKEKVSLYSGYLKQKMYKDAYKFWVEAVETCPEYGPNMYANGVYILKQLRKDKTISKEQKKRYTDSILTVYEAGIKVFGGDPKLLEKYGADLVIYGKNYKEGTKNLKEAIDKLNNKIKYSTYIYYSQALAKLEKAKAVDCELLVQEYDRLSQLIEASKDVKNIQKSQEAIDKYLGPCLTCDKLLPVVEKKFEAAKTDAELRQKTLKLLKDRECTSNKVFKELAIIEADLNPSVDAYEGLALVFYSEGKKKEAIKYFEKAIALEEDAAKKEALLIKTAGVALSSGSSSKASSLAKQALKLNPNNGDAYLIKASVAGRSGCGNSAFERTTKNWVAYDLAAKAKSVDPSVAAKASKAMGSYKARFPEKGELFAQGLKEGQSYTSCLGVSTKVRAK